MRSHHTVRTARSSCRHRPDNDEIGGGHLGGKETRPDVSRTGAATASVVSNATANRTYAFRTSLSFLQTVKK